MIRVFKIAVIALIALVSAIFILPHLVNLDKYSKLIVEKIHRKTGYNISIGGAPSIEIGGNIKLSIPDVLISSEIQNSMQAENILITIPWHNFVFGIDNFNNIEINNSTITINSLEHLKLGHAIKENFNVSTIYLKNADLVLNNVFNINLHNINLRAELDSNNIETVEGNFINNDIGFNLNINLKHVKKGQKTLDLQLNNESLKANLFMQLDKDDSTGKLKINIADSLILAKYLAKIFPFLNNSNILGSKEIIDILADITYQNDIFNLINLKILSQKANGNGSISFAFSNNMQLKTSLSFSSIDLNAIFPSSKIDTSNNASQEQNIFESDESNLSTDNSFIDMSFVDSDLDIKIVSDIINLANFNLENLDLNLSQSNKVLNNSYLNFDVISEGNSSKISITNLMLENVDNINVLLGKFSSTGNNINDTLDLFNLHDNLSIEQKDLQYSLTSQIIISSPEISLFEIVGSIGQNEGTFSGSIATRRSDIDNYNVDLKFNKIALDNFNLPVFKNRLSALLVGSTQDDYLSKFIWFRTLPAAYTIKVHFTDSTFKNNKIDDLSLLCNLSPANMQIRSIIQSSFLNGSFAIDLTALSIKPDIDIKLYGNNLDYNSITSLFSDILPQSTETNVNSNEIWSDDNLNIFKITNYNANFDVDIKNIIFKKYSFNNFKLTGHTKNDILYLDNLGFDIYGGKVQASGNISFFARLLYQFSAAGSNIEAKDFFSNISPLLNVFSGPFSFTSSFVTEGLSSKELVSNLSVSSNFVSTGMTLEGIDSDVLVDIALQRKLTPKNQILGAINTALNSGATSITNLKGSLKGNKGIISCNDLTFKTRFNSASGAFSFDFNNLSLSSNSRFMFMPYIGNIPINYNVIISGNMRDSLQKEIEDQNLVAYIKTTYNIVTEEDIAAEKKMKKEEARKAAQQNQIQDPNDMKYLYYKVQMEENNDQ